MCIRSCLNFRQNCCGNLWVVKLVLIGNSKHRSCVLFWMFRSVLTSVMDADSPSSNKVCGTCGTNYGISFHGTKLWTSVSVHTERCASKWSETWHSAGISGQCWHECCAPSISSHLVRWLPHFPVKLKLALKGRGLFWHRHDSRTVAGNTCLVLNRWWYHMFLTISDFLGLCWRGWHGVTGRFHYHWQRIAV